jgi:hypothetical protein
VIDIKSAYGPDVPGPGSCQGLALVQLGDELVEMHIFGKWHEGKRVRYNLVSYAGGALRRVLRGWDGNLVMEVPS